MESAIHATQIREALERVLSSASFARNDRVSKLLRFLVERHLEARDHELKESVIGVEVFGRRPDYDPKLDSTVRSEAVRLRARLSKYYSAEGSHDPMLIELPKGGYVVRCQLRAAGVKEGVSRRPVWVAIGLASLLLVAAMAIAWVTSRQAPIGIAVLPVLNLSNNQGHDHFVDGLTGEIIRQASGVTGLAVRSRTSSFALEGAGTIREAARRLDVEYIVEASLTGSGPQLRITAQLVRVRDDVALWAGSFDRRVTNTLAIQQEISRAIVNALKVKLGRRGYDTEAFDLYLRARAAGDEHFAGDDKVTGLFEQAIGRDPSMAPAYAGLAVAYAFQSFRAPHDPHRAEQLDKMRAAARRAIELDPPSAEAHGALATAYARDGRWDLAEGSFRRAIEIDPGLSTTRAAFARFVLLPLGRTSEAVREARAATESDPLSPRARSELAEMLLSAGRYNEAADHCEQLPREMISASECVGRARLAQGRTSEAIQIMTSSATSNWGYLAYAYAKAGQREKAETLAASAPGRYPHQRGPFQQALFFAGLGNKDKTIEQLQRMSGVGPVRIGFTLNSPEFAFLEGDLRVTTLRKQVGLPE